MNGFDILMLALLAVLVLVGVLKGLTRILIGIGALVAAFVLASQFHASVASRMTFVDLRSDLLKLLAYVAIFLGTMLAGGLVAYVTRKLLKAAMLSWADRLAGAALGLVAALLIAGLLVLPVVAYSPVGERALRDSRLAPYVIAVADLAHRLVPEELSASYRKRIEGLRQYWRDRWSA